MSNSGTVPADDHIVAVETVGIAVSSPPGRVLSAQLLLNSRQSAPARRPSEQEIAMPESARC